MWLFSSNECEFAFTRWRVSGQAVSDTAGCWDALAARSGPNLGLPWSGGAALDCRWSNLAVGVVLVEPRVDATRICRHDTEQCEECLSDGAAQAAAGGVADAAV